MNRKPSGSPSVARSAGGGSSISTGWVMWMTGTGDTFASASATWREPAHTSSTCPKDDSQRSGKVDTSHHHSPIE